MSVLIRLPTYPFLATNKNHLGEVKEALHTKQQYSFYLHFDLCLALSSPVKQDSAHGRSDFDSPSNSSSPLPTSSCRFLAIMGRVTCPSQGLTFGYVSTPAPTRCAQRSSFSWEVMNTADWRLQFSAG